MTATTATEQAAQSARHATVTQPRPAHAMARSQQTLSYANAMQASMATASHATHVHVPTAMLRS